MKLNLKHTTIFFFLFIIMTVIGTLSHEMGHISVAKYLGYETKLHYGSMNFDNKKTWAEVREIYRENKVFIEKKQDFPEKEKFYSLQKKADLEGFFVTAGGVLQTVLTGTIGFILLLYRRKKQIFNKLDWIFVFLTLFWTREAFNHVTLVISQISGKKIRFRSDEIKLALYYDLPYWSISLIFAIIGFMICTYTIFRIIPKEYKFSFTTGGFFGGLAGFYLWLVAIGPKILP